MLSLAMSLFAGTAHASEPYDIEVYKISAKNLKTGSSTFSEGQTIQIDCNWSVSKASAKSSWAPMAWNRYIKVDGKTIHEGTAQVSPSFETKISYGFGWTWDAKGTGAHTITCGLGNPKHTDINPANNEKSTVVQVSGPLKAKTPPGNVQYHGQGIPPPPPTQQPQSPPGPTPPRTGFPRQ
jgi:hypothetical protein